MNVRRRKKIRIGVGLVMPIAALVFQLSPVAASETVDVASSETVEAVASQIDEVGEPMGCIHVTYYENGTVDVHLHCCDDPGHPCKVLPYLEGFCGADSGAIWDPVLRLICAIGP